MPCPKVQGASTACAAADHFGGGLGGGGLGGGGLIGGGLGGGGLGGFGLGGGGLGGGGLGGEGLQVAEPKVHSCPLSSVGHHHVAAHKAKCCTVDGQAAQSQTAHTGSAQTWVEVATGARAVENCRQAGRQTARRH
jgi:hypothetical protein